MEEYNKDTHLFEKACEDIKPDDIESGENVIEWIRGQDKATVQFAGHNRFCNRVKQYARDFPEEVQIVGENRDGSIVAHLPLSYISVRRPSHRDLTDEQKQELRERLAKARENRNA